MQERFINEGTFAGRVFSHSFEQKISKAGKKYYTGKLNLATEGDTGIIQIAFSYVAETNYDGTPNKTFNIINDMIQQKKTIKESGLEKAMIIGVNRALLEKNEYYSSKFRTEEGEPTFSSFEQFKGSYMYEMKSVPTEECNRNYFAVDAFVTNVELEEGDDSTPERAMITCALFDNNMKLEDGYGVGIIPFKMPVYSQGGINYFLGIKNGTNAEGITLPMFTKLVGKVQITTEEKEVQHDDPEDTMSAFGEETAVPTVTPSKRSTRETVILNAKRTPYTLGLDTTITIEEMKKLNDERNARLEKMKAETLNRMNNSNQNTAFDTPSNNAAPVLTQEEEDLPFNL